jgi:hypothetical protein
MPSFPVASEILSFVTTSVSVTDRLFYPEGSGSHFPRTKCLSLMMLTVRGIIVPLRHTSEMRDSKCTVTLTCTFSNTYNVLVNRKLIKCPPGQSVLYRQWEPKFKQNYVKNFSKNISVGLKRKLYHIFINIRSIIHQLGGKTMRSQDERGRTKQY